jgi:hypothetical protein
MTFHMPEITKSDHVDLHLENYTLLFDFELGATASS